MCGEVRDQLERPRRTRSTFAASSTSVCTSLGSQARVSISGGRRAELVVAALGMHLRALECLARLRVRYLLAPERVERRELLAAALAHGFGDRGVVVVGEELERPLLAVLLALEEQRDVRREQDAGRRNAPHAAGSRSPRALLPTWSWFAEQITSRSGGVSS